MIAPDNTTLRMERTYRAPAQAVFDAWTSEEVMRRWWHAEHDWETTEATVDLRVGGAVRVVMRNPTRTSSTAAAAVRAHYPVTPRDAA